MAYNDIGLGFIDARYPSICIFSPSFRGMMMMKVVCNQYKGKWGEKKADERLLLRKDYGSFWIHAERVLYITKGIQGRYWSLFIFTLLILCHHCLSFIIIACLYSFCLSFVDFIQLHKLPWVLKSNRLWPLIFSPPHTLLNVNKSL